MFASHQKVFISRKKNFLTTFHHLSGMIVRHLKQMKSSLGAWISIFCRSPSFVYWRKLSKHQAATLQMESRNSKQIPRSRAKKQPKRRKEIQPILATGIKSSVILVSRFTANSHIKWLSITKIHKMKITLNCSLRCLCYQNHNSNLIK